MCTGNEIELVVRIYFAGLMFFVPHDVTSGDSQPVNVLVVDHDEHRLGVVARSACPQQAKTYTCLHDQAWHEGDGPSPPWTIEFEWVREDVVTEGPAGGVEPVGGNWGGQDHPSASFPARPDDLGSYAWIATARQLLDDASPKVREECLELNTEDCPEVKGRVLLKAGLLGTCDFVYRPWGGKRSIPAANLSHGPRARRAVSEVMVQELKSCTPESETRTARIHITGADGNSKNIDIGSDEFPDCPETAPKRKRKCLDISIHNLPPLKSKPYKRGPGSRADDYAQYYRLLGIEDPRFLPVPMLPTEALFDRKVVKVEPLCRYPFTKGDVYRSEMPLVVSIQRVLQDQTICPNGGL